jgi:hypothetical protein
MKIIDKVKIVGVIIGVLGTALFLISTISVDTFSPKYNSLFQASMMFGLLLFLFGMLFSKSKK